MTAAAIFAWSGGCLLAGTAIGWVVRGFRRDFALGRVVIGASEKREGS